MVTYMQAVVYNSCLLISTYSKPLEILSKYRIYKTFLDIFTFIFGIKRSRNYCSIIMNNNKQGMVQFMNGKVGRRMVIIHISIKSFIYSVPRRGLGPSRLSPRLLTDLTERWFRRRLRGT